MQPAAGGNLPQTHLFVVPATFVGFLILGFYVATQTPDPLMGLQAWTFMAGVGIALIHLIRRYAEGIPADDKGAYTGTRHDWSNGSRSSLSAARETTARFARKELASVPSPSATPALEQAGTNV